MPSFWEGQDFSRVLNAALSMRLSPLRFHADHSHPLSSRGRDGSGHFPGPGGSLLRFTRLQQAPAVFIFQRVEPATMAAQPEMDHPVGVLGRVGVGMILSKAKKFSAQVVVKRESAFRIRAIGKHTGPLHPRRMPLRYALKLFVCCFPGERFPRPSAGLLPDSESWRATTCERLPRVPAALHSGRTNPLFRPCR